MSGDGSLGPLERPQPRAQAVADALREFVHGRRLVPGDRLPSEGELIEMLGVGRSSVREGVQLLESLGVVSVEQGKGTFLASDFGGGLARVMTWAYPAVEKARLLDDLLDARVIVESALAGMAAERASDEEVDGLRASTSLPRAPGASEAARAGREYHHLVATMSHNDILRIVANALRALLAPIQHDLGRTEEELTIALSEHSAVTAAIVERDAAGAANAMKEHLESIRAMLSRSLALDADEGKPPLG